MTETSVMRIRIFVGELDANGVPNGDQGEANVDIPMKDFNKLPTEAMVERYVRPAFSAAKHHMDEANAPTRRTR